MHLLTLMVLAALSPAVDVDYMRDVKPLLAKHCVACHGEARPRGGLRLDTGQNAIQGGKSGVAIVAGKPEESTLLEAVSDEAGEGRMPLKRAPLSPSEIATLKSWIELGAVFPKDETPTHLSETHWAFVAPKRPSVPVVKDPEWSRHPVDAFIRARLEMEGLKPSPEADRRTLIRRLSLDLIGLPPSLREISEFVDDTSPNAYDRLVDRLLASPRYGERWARPWLDLARYADSNGYSVDAPRSIWKYRDWVINALNRDLPFDEFLTDQLAGDLRPNATLEQRVATGFHRNTQINEEGGIDPEQFRSEAIADRVNTTATTFLGLTVGCAQCHDHKYDPIAQREYYQLYAFFNNVDEPEIEFASPEEIARRDRIHAEIVRLLEQIPKDHPTVSRQLIEWEANLAPAFKVDQPSETKKTFDVPFEKRSKRQNQLLLELFLASRPEYGAEFSRLGQLRRDEPKFVKTLVVKERKTPRPTFIHIAGDFTRIGGLVSAGVPKVLPSLSSNNPPNRLDLARWLVDPAHPLTSRVLVNRIWQTYFGMGLVETENDFGTQGSPPSHPELLDWLALEMIARNWSFKDFHRLIVTSRTYKQASIVTPESSRIDPRNKWLSHQSRIRLDAEIIRDSTLFAAGLLSPKIGGPSVFPPQPEGVMGQGQVKRVWKVSEGEDRYRRGLYTFYWRSTPHPSLTIFDAPNAVQACTRRARSNTPVQALLLLNDDAYIEAAKSLASRLARESAIDDVARIDHAFRLCLSRPPTPRELAIMTALLERDRSDPSAREKSLTEWTTVARVLLNLDEFITRE